MSTQREREKNKQTHPHKHLLHLIFHWLLIMHRLHSVGALWGTGLRWVLWTKRPTNQTSRSNLSALNLFGAFVRIQNAVAQNLLAKLMHFKVIRREVTIGRGVSRWLRPAKITFYLLPGLACWFSQDIQELFLEHGAGRATGRCSVRPISVFSFRKGMDVDVPVGRGLRQACWFIAPLMHLLARPPGWTARVEMKS